MPRARRAKKNAQNGLEIHLRVLRLPGPFPMFKHEQILPFHAEEKGLGARWSVQTTQDAEAPSGSFSVCFSSNAHMLLILWSEEA